MKVVFSFFQLNHIAPSLNKKLAYGSFCFILIISVFYLSCNKEIVPKPYRPSIAHEAYRLSLEQAGLAETSLGKDWIAASINALRRPVEIALPFKEAFYIDSTSAFALAYQFNVLRGQRIEMDVNIDSRQPIRLFIDLFRVTGDSTKPWIQVASADENEKRFEFEPRRDAQYIARLQSELLRGGRCNVTIRKMASLAFPVPKRNKKSILSFFGDPRDGGRREHHGVDIFASRHTPIIAPARAQVRHVGESGIGGHVIWLWDSKRLLYYYFAHLQSDRVEKNTWVDAGQTIGTIGNSGNARTTSPHLHFGIYASGSGPVDPYYFITKTDSIPDDISADLETVGKWVRSKSNALKLMSSGGSHLNHFPSLKRHSAMKVLAAAKNMYRVSLPDGFSGYIEAQVVEPMETPLQHRSVSVPQIIREYPEKDAVAVEYLNPGKDFVVLGEFNDHWFVREQQGRMGWMEISLATSTRSSSQ